MVWLNTMRIDSSPLSAHVEVLKHRIGMWNSVLQRCHMSAPLRPLPMHGEGQTSCVVMVRAHPERIWRSHHHIPADSSAPHREAGSRAGVSYWSAATSSWVPAGCLLPLSHCARFRRLT